VKLRGTLDKVHPKYLPAILIKRFRAKKLGAFFFHVKPLSEIVDETCLFSCREIHEYAPFGGSW